MCLLTLLFILCESGSHSVALTGMEHSLCSLSCTKIFSFSASASQVLSLPVFATIPNKVRRLKERRRLSDVKLYYRWERCHIAVMDIYCSLLQFFSCFSETGCPVALWVSVCSLEAEPFLGVSCLQGLLRVPVLNREGFFNNANIFKELQMLCH